MNVNSIDDLSLSDICAFLEDSVGALVVADRNKDVYRAAVRRGFFAEYIDESGAYHTLIEKLWYHFNNSGDTITEDYKVFIPLAGVFTGKRTKKLRFISNGVAHIIQMKVCPVNEDIYVFVLDELDENEMIDESLTEKKVTAIQNTYLFSMYFDIIRDTTSSINISEISEENVDTQIKYSDWRMMIVNMIGKDDQALFLERTSPEYLKNNFAPGRTSSFDCLMQNLEGNYIWVKLIFSRAETSNADDYRFVFMVQNIHENTVKLISALKKYEELALRDPLTSLYNHGRMETELFNAVDAKNKTGDTASAAILDIDFFKSINDNYGHHTGDSTLVRFSSAMKDFFRDKNCVFGRWGGEEFVVVLYGRNINEAAELAEALRNNISNEHFERIGKLTCSIGLTEIIKDDDFNSVFDRMDKALYNAKSAGRNKVVTL